MITQTQNLNIAMAITHAFRPSALRGFVYQVNAFDNHEMYTDFPIELKEKGTVP